MANIPVEGGGEGTAEWVDVNGPEFTASGVGGTFEPAYVENVDVQLTGNTDSVTDQCGYTEVYRNGTVTNWTVSAEGIIDDMQLEVLMSLAESDKTVTVATPALGSRGGEYVVKKCSIQHTDDLNKLELPYGANSDTAFRFKIDFASPQSVKTGGA